MAIFQSALQSQSSLPEWCQTHEEEWEVESKISVHHPTCYLIAPEPEHVEPERNQCYSAVHWQVLEQKNATL